MHSFARDTIHIEEFMTLPPSIKWLAASVRVSFFCAAQVRPGVGLFESITGRKPEAVHQQPQQGQCMEVGSQGGGPGQLMIQSVINRIDIINQAIPSFGGRELPTLGSPAESIREIAELARNWIEKQSDHSITRVAVGCMALAHTSDLAQAAEVALTALPKIDIDVSQVEDILVQMNFPTTSETMPGLRVNRLSKVGAVQVELMRIGPVDAPGASVVRNFAAQYEIDINTDANRSTPIDSEAIAKLLPELVSHIDSAYAVARVGG